MMKEFKASSEILFTLVLANPESFTEIRLIKDHYYPAM